LYSDFIYYDSTIKPVVEKEDGITDSIKIKTPSLYNTNLSDWFYSTDASKYKVYLWDKSAGASITGGTKEMKELSDTGDTIGTIPSLLKEKTILN
jgi:hypothetical protein